MTLGTLSRRTLFRPHSSHYKNEKDMFIRVRGKDDTSMVITRDDDTPSFPLFWTEDTVVITNYDYDYLTITERELVDFLSRVFYCTFFFIVEKMSFIMVAERKVFLEKKKEGYNEQWTDNPKIHKGDHLINGN